MLMLCRLNQVRASCDLGVRFAVNESEVLSPVGEFKAEDFGGPQDWVSVGGEVEDAGEDGGVGEGAVEEEVDWDVFVVWGWWLYDGLRSGFSGFR